MYREAIKKLEKWKNSSRRKPLIVNGARQVGKTYLLKEFGSKYYEKFAYINMDNNIRMKELFEGDFDTSRLIQGLKIESGVNIEPGNTLIVLDEAQEVLNSIAALKYFNENANEYHIIIAGSLLGITLHKGIAFPVGKVDFLNMYPLNFKEYLIALGKKDFVKIIEEKNEDMLKIFASDIKNYLREYYYIGGMPEVVNDYVNNKDYIQVREIQNAILKDYEEDFSKHIPEEQIMKVKQIWDNFNSQISKENKKFVFGALKQGARGSEYEDAINWLVNAGLLIKVNRVNNAKLPLSGYTDYNAFKLYFLDVGLLSAKNKLDVKTLLEKNRIFTEYKGALTEQYVLTELISNYDITPFYYTSDSRKYEIDFLIDYDNKVIPVEVKSEENVQAKSLKEFIDKNSTEINIRTSMLDYKVNDKITNIPLYSIGSFDTYL